MNELIRILHLEDSFEDAELIRRKLNNIFKDCSIKHTDNRDEYVKALDSFEPDIILSDYGMPHFNGLEALKIAQDYDDKIPFIILTGSINEETAVKCIRAGANDYIIKEHLIRLESAILSALEQSSLIREKLKSTLDRKKLMAAIESTDEIIIITDNQGTIEYVNHAFEVITGYNKHEAINKNPKFLQSGLHGKNFYETLWKTISSGHIWKGRIKNKRKNGIIYTEETTISPVFDKQHKILNYVGVKRDITNDIIFENQMRQSDKMDSIGILACGIAHDFNNILAVICGYSEIIIGYISSDTKLLNYMAQITKASQRAKDLVDQILKFSHRTDVKLCPVNLKQIVEETLHLLRASIPSTIEIVTDIDLNCGNTFADPTQINQIIMNLCTNAKHAMMPGGGTLKISLKQIEFIEKTEIKNFNFRPGKYIIMTISDTGKGISNDIKDKIFDPFFTTKDIGEGTGLGLSVVHGIVKACSGYIDVHSKLGTGTTFNVYFPQIEEISPEVNVTPAFLEGGSERILLIDDEPDLIEMMEIILSKLGYKVTSLSDSREALTLFCSDPEAFDIVITDMTMPKIDGAALSQKMIEVRNDIPIVLCTGYSETISIEDAKEIGVKELALKPISKSEISKIIRKVLEDS